MNKIKQLRDKLKRLETISGEITEIQNLLKNLITDKIEKIEFSYELKMGNTNTKENILDEEGDLKPKFLDDNDNEDFSVSLPLSISNFFGSEVTMSGPEPQKPKLFLDLSEDTQIKVLNLILIEKEKEQKNLVKHLRRKGVQI